MGNVTTIIQIEAPSEKVFAFAISEKMNDVWKEWTETKWISDGPVGVGSISHFVGQGSWSNMGEWDMEVTEFVKNKKMTMRTIGAAKVNATDSMVLEPTTKGTKITYSENYKVSYSVLGKLIDKLKVSKEMEKNNRKMLENLKKLLRRNLKVKRKDANILSLFFISKVNII